MAFALDALDAGDGPAPFVAALVAGATDDNDDLEALGLEPLCDVDDPGDAYQMVRSAIEHTHRRRRAITHVRTFACHECKY